MAMRLVENGHAAVKSCKHGIFLFNPNDTFIGRSLDLYGEWCEDELQTLGQILRPGMVVIDVGANIGTHAVYFAKHVAPQGQVFAFEPQRLVFQQLCANLALNGLLNVIAIPKGVAAASGSIRLVVQSPEQVMNFAIAQLGEGPQSEDVALVTIDSYDFPRCDLIKIDVDGIETSVLAGARKTIERCQPVLFVENDTLERSQSILAAIASLGYVAYWQIANYFNPNNYFGNAKNVFAAYQPQANLLCFPASLHVAIDGYEPVGGDDDNWQKAARRIVAARRGKS